MTIRREIIPLEATNSGIGALVAAMARSRPPPDRVLIELFLDMLAAERGAAANTLAAYTGDLEDFSAHLAGARRRIATASSEDVRAYLAALSAREFSAASVARRLSAVRQLFRFL